MDNHNEYVVIIGDIIESKKIQNRARVQEQFKEVLRKINVEYKKEIASNFIITVGDEFQGLLQTKKDILSIIQKIDVAMYPVQIRYGIGIGTISSEIDEEKSNEIDGPAYHRARNMIESIEESEKGNKKPIITMMIDSGTLEDKLVNGCLSMMSTLKSTWTERQTEIVYAYLVNQQNQHVTASALSVQQSTINRSLNAANYYSYRYAQEQINAYLREEV